MLTSLALARQESISTETFEVYLRALSGFSRDLLQPALERLMVERHPYSKPFPTTDEIAEACREESGKRGHVKNRYCGHCTDGSIRLSSGQIVDCECVCPACRNRGVCIVRANGEPYDSRLHWREDSFARVCDCRRSA